LNWEGIDQIAARVISMVSKKLSLVGSSDKWCVGHRRVSHWVALLVVTLIFQSPFAWAQQQALQQETVQEAVSQDLIAIYQKSEQQKTVDELDAMIDSLKEIALDRGRTSTDRAYARDLLSWSLNRRGEIRSDLAALKVQQGLLNDASELDTAAAADFRGALKLNPQRWRARHNLAISLAMANSFEDAIEQFGIVIREKPDYANAYFNRAELFFQTDRHQEAIADYTAAIRLQPKDSQYYNSRGHSYLILNKSREALADYRKATELDKGNGDWWADLADAHQFLGNWKESLAAYRSAIEANRELGRAYQNAAWLMATCPDASLRSPKSALAAARKAIEIDGEEDPRYLDTLAAALAINGQFNDAVETQKEAIEKVDGDDEELRSMKQRLLAYQNRKVFSPRSSNTSNSQTAVRPAADTEPVGTGTKKRR
jgi:tetratricopeptide (TPR) repeat protein